MKASPIRCHKKADVLNGTEAKCTEYDVNKAAENQHFFYYMYNMQFRYIFFLRQKIEH